MYPNKENIIVVPITKRMEIIKSFQDCLISRTNFDYEENGRKKAFLANSKHQYRLPNVENLIVVPIIKKNSDY